MRRVILLTLLVLTGCIGSSGAGETVTDTASIARELQYGTQGIVTEILPGTPQPYIYDTNDLVAIINLRNRGNFEVQPRSCYISITGFDPKIITGLNVPEDCTGDGTTPLEKRELHNREGGFSQVEFTSTNIDLPEGILEYSPTLNFLTCYKYQTQANPQVCIDPKRYDITNEIKTCESRDISLGSGQGGPVGVSYVNVDSTGTHAIFEINIQNFDKGRILDSGASILQCHKSNFEYKDFDKVDYQVTLGQHSPENCKPKDNKVRMINGQGKIICRFPITQNAQSYTTPLQIRLNYNYMDSERRDIQIIKTPN